MAGTYQLLGFPHVIREIYSVLVLPIPSKPDPPVPSGYKSPRHRWDLEPKQRIRV